MNTTTCIFSGKRVGFNSIQPAEYWFCHAVLSGQLRAGVFASDFQPMDDQEVGQI